MKYYNMPQHYTLKWLRTLLMIVLLALVLICLVSHTHTQAAHCYNSIRTAAMSRGP